MAVLLLWLILVVLSWPLALLALILYPAVWLFLLPFRIIGFAADGVSSFIKALILMPSRIVKGRPPEQSAS